MKTWLLLIPSLIIIQHARAQDVTITSVNQSVSSPAFSVDLSGNATFNNLTALVLPTLANTARQLAVRFSDSLNVRDYGAKCDGNPSDAGTDTAAFQAAFAAATSSARIGGTEIYVPSGTCELSGNVTGAVPAGNAVALYGAGIGSTKIVSSAATAISLSMSDATSAVEVSDLTVRHASSTQSGTGLSISSSVFGSYVTLHDLIVDGNTGAGTGSWLTGVDLVSVRPALNHVMIYLPNGSSAGDTAASVGVGLLLDGGTSGVFIADAVIVNSKFQGGYAGEQIKGAVQGVFNTNVQSIGNDVGFDWEASTSDSAELFSLINSHVNSHSAAVKTNNLAGINILGNYVYRFDPSNDVSYHGFDLENSQEINVVGNSLAGTIGYPSGGVEDFGIFPGDQQVAMTGNTAYTISGTMGDFSTAGLVTATGNRISNHPSPQKPLFMVAGNPPQPAAYQIYGNAASDTGTDIDSSTGTLKINVPMSAAYNLSLPNGALFASGGVLPITSGTAISLGDTGGVSVTGAILSKVGDVRTGGTYNGAVDFLLNQSTAPIYDCRELVSGSRTTSNGSAALSFLCGGGYTFNAGISGTSLALSGGMTASQAVVDQSPVGVSVTSGATVTVPDGSSGVILACNSSTTLASLTVKMPSNPLPRQRFEIGPQCTVTALTVTAGTSTGGVTPIVLGIPAGVTPATPVTWIYEQTGKAWTRW